jgi:hypothetical protein
VQANKRDYLSKVAVAAGLLSLPAMGAFVLDNAAQISSLDASLEGLELVICNPAAGKVDRRKNGAYFYNHTQLVVERVYILN